MIVDEVASPSAKAPESSISFFKTLDAAAPCGPPIAFISTCCEVPFRTVITGPLASSPNRVVTKQREKIANAETFILLVAFVLIYALNARSQLDAGGTGTGRRVVVL